MSWRDRMRPASFRRVPFDVDASELSGGRRLAVHEFPQQGAPYAEDMGRATLRIHLTAVVLGEDYFTTRQLLLEALETPGPGVLVHPHYGEFDVSVESYTVREDNAGGRMAVFEIDFIESGDHQFPISGLNAPSVALEAANLGKLLLGYELEASWDVSVAWVLADAAEAFADVVDTFRDAVLGPLADELEVLGSINRSLDSMAASASALVATPADLVTEITDVLTAIGDVGEGSLDVFKALFGDAGSAAHEPAGDTDADAAAARNRTTLDRLIIRCSLFEACRVSALVTLDSYDAMIALRDALADALAAEAEVSDPGDVYDALTDARVAVVDDLTSRATRLARLRTFTPTAVLPACVLAYDLYGDASRGAEIVARNRIAHPGFVPATAIQVLSS